MKLGNILNQERVGSLRVDSNAYTNSFKSKSNSKATIQSAEKVIFPEPYENAGNYYNKNMFNSPKPQEPQNPQCHAHNQNNFPMFDIKSILPMLMGGKFNDVLTPLMSLFAGKGGGGGMDFAKIFELFKPKLKAKTEEKKEENVSSKFDDFIIIED